MRYDESRDNWASTGEASAFWTLILLGVSLADASNLVVVGTLGELAWSCFDFHSSNERRTPSGPSGGSIVGRGFKQHSGGSGC